MVVPGVYQWKACLLVEIHPPSSSWWISWHLRIDLLNDAGIHIGLHEPLVVSLLVESFWTLDFSQNFWKYILCRTFICFYDLNKHREHMKSGESHCSFSFDRYLLYAYSSHTYPLFIRCWIELRIHYLFGWWFCIALLYPFYVSERRQAESARIREKYPDRIPVKSFLLSIERRYFFCQSWTWKWKVYVGSEGSALNRSSWRGPKGVTFLISTRRS